MKTARIRLGDVVARAEFFDEKTPRTVAAIWRELPILDRTIHVRWSGAAWRTEKDYPLHIGEVENPTTWLQPGDIIYYDDPRYSLFKLGFAYGRAQWRDDKGELSVARIGRIVDNLDAFVRASERILFDGPLSVEINEEERRV